MERLDIYNRKGLEFEKELKRLGNAGISPKNKEIIQRYHKHLYARGCSETRVSKLSGQLRKIAGLLNKDFDVVQRQDLEDLIAKINTEKLNTRIINHCYNKKLYLSQAKQFSSETKFDYWRIIKSFFKWLDQNTDLFKDWKPYFGSRQKEIGNIITDENLNEVLAHCNSTRDRALLSIIHETGMRAGEILNLKLKDFQREEKYTKVRVFGKTGERRIIIIHSVPYLLRWLENHPKKDEPESYLWISEHPRYRNQPLVHTGLKKIIQVAFKNAGLSHLKHNPHFFRHSRATINARFMTDVQMRMFFGWTKDSSQVATYVHASGRDLDTAVLAMYGIEETKESEKRRPLYCSICKTQNEESSDFCRNCGHPLNLKVALETEEKVNSEINKTLKVLMEIAKNPELMKQFEEFKKGCEKK